MARRSGGCIDLRRWDVVVFVGIVAFAIFIASPLLLTAMVAAVVHFRVIIRTVLMTLKVGCG